MGKLIKVEFEVESGARQDEVPVDRAMSTIIIVALLVVMVVALL